MLNEASCLSRAHGDHLCLHCVYMRTLYPLPGAALGLGAAEVDELHADVRSMEAEELVEVDPAWVGLRVEVKLSTPLGKA